MCGWLTRIIGSFYIWSIPMNTRWQDVFQMWVSLSRMCGWLTCIIGFLCIWRTYTRWQERCSLVGVSSRVFILLRHAHIICHRELASKRARVVRAFSYCCDTHTYIRVKTTGRIEGTTFVVVNYKYESIYISQLYKWVMNYGVATVSKIDTIIGLFCRILSF